MFRLGSLALCYSRNRRFSSHLAIMISLAACFISGGCASKYEGLRSERDIPRFAPLIARASTMPVEVARFATTRPGEPAVRIAINRTGNPNATGPILVFIHGAFSDSQAWRYLVGALGEDHTLWLVDLPGCGHSDAPSPRDLAPDGYGPTALADRMYQAVGQALGAEPAGRPVVLVGHSLGALLVTRMLCDPQLRARHAAVLARVKGLFLITPLDVAIEKPVPMLEVAARITGFEVVMGRLTGQIKERIAEGVLQSYDDPSVSQREEADRGVGIISDRAKRDAMQAMILEATPRRSDVARPDWRTVDSLSSEYCNIDVPVRILCGAHDETLPVSMSYKLSAQIPGATLRVLPDCMHSPHLEQPQTCAKVLCEFLARLTVPTTRPVAG